MVAGTFEKILRNPFFAILLIASVAVAIYSNVYESPFVFDDIRQIEDKAKIRNLRNYLSTNILFCPRPLVELTFALNYRFGGLNVFGYHLVNIIIHVINGWLVYFLAFTLLSQPNMGVKKNVLRENTRFLISLISIFSALVFISHPLQTQAVTYMAQRYTSMGAMFYFLSVLCYARARVMQKDIKMGAEPKVAFGVKPITLYILSVLCGGMAFLSKQNTASLPGIILLIEYIAFDRTWQGWRRKLVGFIPLFVIMGIFIFYVSGIFRQGIQFGTLLEDVSAILRAPETYVSRWTYLCTQFSVIVIYIRLLFLPIGQNLDYMYPFKSGFFDGYTPVAFLLLVGIIGISIWLIKRRPIISLGILWFFITLSVESSIFPIKDALFEHRLYLPMFGFALVISYIVFSLLPLKQLWRVALCVVVILAFGLTSHFRNAVYNSPATLWADVVSKSPENYRAWYNFGNALREQGRFEESIESYKKALCIRPDFTVAQDNLGVVLTEKGRLDEAIQNFLEALKARPGDPRIHCNLGTALMHQGKLEDAIQHFLKALQKRPHYVEARNNLGIAFARKGDLEKAVKHFSKALHRRPQDAEVQSNMGFALMLQGKLPESIEHLSKAVKLKPDYAEAHNRLGLALSRLGDYDEAISHFSKALEINPGFEQARLGLNRAMHLNRQKRF